MKGGKDMNILEIAKKVRKAAEAYTATLSDEDIMEHQESVEKWKPEKTYKAGKRLVYNDTVYKVVQPHTSQKGKTPDSTPELFTYIDENGKTVLQGKGAADNPFDIVDGIILIQNAYYQADGVRYVYMGEANKTYSGEALTEDNGFIEF